MATPMTHIWMALDPETLRVTAQAREWADGDFPPGPRGLDWPRREYDVPTATWTKLKRGVYPNHTQDRLHREWWSEAGDSEWPLSSGPQH